MRELQTIVVYARLPRDHQQRARTQLTLDPVDIRFPVGEEHQRRHGSALPPALREIAIVHVGDQTESAPGHRKYAHVPHMRGERHLLPDFRFAQRLRRHGVGDAERIVGQRVADRHHTQRFQRTDSATVAFDGRNRGFQCGAHNTPLCHDGMIVRRAEFPTIARHAENRGTGNKGTNNSTTADKAKPRQPNRLTGVSSCYFAIHASTRWTLPALMHFTQTRTRTFSPSMVVRTGCRFGRKVRLLRICECETVKPVCGPLPHTAQRAAIMDSL